VALEVVAPAIGGLGQAQLVQHDAELFLSRRLVDRAAQVADRRVGGPASRGVARRIAQHRHAVGIARARQPQQMPGHALALGVARGHHRGGARVQALALEGRDLPVDRAAHHRVDEVEIQVAAGRERYRPRTVRAPAR
jgi:hypothetical protein